jgi:penicillin-binding protein 1A
VAKKNKTMFEASGRLAPRKGKGSAILRWIGRLFWLSVLFVVLAGGAAVGGYFYYTQDLPSLDKLGDYRPAQLVRVLDRRGNVIGEIGTEKRTVIPFADVPKLLVQAVVAAEDATFFQNPGLDVKGIARAVFENVLRDSDSSGRRASGGSTITQQVIKRLLLSPERTIKRKVQELVLAYRLTNRLSKEEILELYLNDIYFGHGRYGCEEAARYFFGKSIREVDLGEAALLAGLPQGPERLSPFKHPDAAKTRQRYVLTRMVELGFVPREVAIQFANEPITVVRSEGLDVVPEIMTMVNAMGGGALTRTGGSVQTTIDADLQALARRAVHRGLEAIDLRQRYRAPIRILKDKALKSKLAELIANRGGSAPSQSQIVEAVVTKVVEQGNDPNAGQLFLDLGGIEAVIQLADEKRFHAGKVPMAKRFVPGSLVRVRLTGKPNENEKSYPAVLEHGPQAAMVVLDVATSDVLAIVGGYDFTAGGFDRARQARRQPGSSFKPFVYGAALETQRFTPASIINDAPDVYDLWKPSNYSKEFRGPVRLRTALANSINTVSIKLLAEIGIPALRQYCDRMGFEKPIDEQAGLSLALGSHEVSPLELASAYLPVWNGGARVHPRFFLRVGDQIEAEPTRLPAISAEVGYLVSSMMESVIKEGTAASAGRVLGRPAAGKTGTSNDLKDAWFVGATPDLLAVVWVGFDDMRVLGKGETGTAAALPIWLDFMKAANEGKPIRSFTQPPGIRVQTIDPATGALPAPGVVGIDEVFINGTEPHEQATTTDDSADRLLLGQ